MPKMRVAKQEGGAVADQPSSDRPRRQLGYPPATRPPRIYWSYAIALSLVHGLALLACVPWLFSWTGVAIAVCGHFLFGMCGITIGYHRLLTHRGFKCPTWFEHLLAILGICTLQDSPARWVAIHRLHHKHSDEPRDPHSPLVTFFWGHMGWLFIQNRDYRELSHFEQYARDLLRDKFYLNLERHSRWLGVYLLHALLIFLAGCVGGWLITGSTMGAIQLGLSWLVWGVFVRTVFVLHGTWAVNSIAHIWGYRNYETSDNSRNNWLVAILAHGEGWHNNHHADQRAAAHGHKWWEFDMSWRIIRMFEMMGIISEVIEPRSWKGRLEQTSP